MVTLYRFFRQLPVWLQTTASLITIGGFAFFVIGAIASYCGTSDNRPQVTHLLPVVAEPFAMPSVSPILVEPQPTATPAPTPTPTPIPPLGEQLEWALSIDGVVARGDGLKAVAIQAVLLTDYWTAIRAAAATPNISAQAINLELVIDCAVEDGQFSMATEAANMVESLSSRNDLMIKALEAREPAIRREAFPPPTSAQSAQPRVMLCLEAGRE